MTVKISLTITAVVASVGFLIGTLMIAQDWQRFHDELGEKALLLAGSIAATTPRSILRKDYWTLYQSLKNIASGRPETSGSHKVLSAMILDEEGVVQAHLQPGEYPLGLPFSPVGEAEIDLLRQAASTRVPLVINYGGFSAAGFQEGVVPLFFDQKYMGMVRVRLSVAQLYEKAKNTFVAILFLVFALVIVGSTLGAYFSRRMVRPLTAVTQGLEAVGRGEMTDFAPVPVRSGDEIGRLSATFNQIMAELAEKKMLEEEMAMSEKLVALGRITAGVAHEVNNPLAGLLNCIDTLRKHPDDKELIDRYLPVIDQGLHRIRDIVHNLLVGLRNSESDEVLSKDHIDMLRDLITAEIGSRNIEIAWNNEIDSSFDLPGRLDQIVCNLLKNAVEAVPDCGIITFRMYSKDPYLMIEVSDNGPGIPPDMRKQLFDPFFTTKPNGTGLGLWVVYRLVQSMEGMIEVKSELGRGTIFFLAIPITSRKAA